MPLLELGAYKPHKPRGGNVETEKTKEFRPPYIAFPTFITVLDKMAEHDAPPRIDRSYLNFLSGINQTYVMAALRTFGLTGQDNTVRPELVELAQNKSERKRLIGDLLRKHYPKAVELGEIKGTQRQLEEAFGEFGISGDTLRKAVAFYLKAAEFAGLPRSPHFRAVAKTGSAGGRRSASTRKRQTKTPDPPPPSPGPETDRHSTLNPLSEEYVKLLMKKVESQEEVDDNLLDRIERMLGYEPSARDEGADDQ
jgi:hypothetical protein